MTHMCNTKAETDFLEQSRKMILTQCMSANTFVQKMAAPSAVVDSDALQRGDTWWLEKYGTRTGHIAITTGFLHGTLNV